MGLVHFGFLRWVYCSGAGQITPEDMAIIYPYPTTTTHNSARTNYIILITYYLSLPYTLKKSGFFSYQFIISIAHVIMIIKSEVSTFPIVFHIFPWLCAWDVCDILSLIVYTFRDNREFVFISIVQFMMSANSRLRFGLQIVFVCLYITPSHYHHCANFIWRHWTYKMTQI